MATTVSVVSAGTWRMLVDFGSTNLLDKARQQPEKARNKLDQTLPICDRNVGRLVEVVRGVEGFWVGDRVASNGRDAEQLAVLEKLCAKAPDAVSDEAAVLAALGTISLQGIRTSLVPSRP